MRDKSCPNMNHKRPNALVRVCPNCGEVVNPNIPAKKCNEKEHADRRRKQNKFCTDCGEQLIH
ncbi:MAG: hypothetical protein GY847_19600 [Proteobacteria bacterium]|nr:hypothetical protein [Pseudomonadota bacterium]